MTLKKNIKKKETAWSVIIIEKLRYPCKYCAEIFKNSYQLCITQ